MPVVLVSRWAGGPRSDWYPWLVEALAADGIEVLVPRMPRPERAEIGAWAAALDALVGAAPLHTLGFVGHSVGCQAILRHLAARADEGPARGVVAVAGWWEIVDPWPTLRPWLAIDYDVAAAARRAGPVELVIGDDDPYTPDHAANAELWRARTGARAHVWSGHGHLNHRELPALAALCRARFAGLAPR